MNEQPSSPENIDLRSKAIEALKAFKEGGDECRQAAGEAVSQWIQTIEASRNIGEIGELDVALAYAQIYEEAGLLELALDAYDYDNALSVAEGEKNKEVEKKIRVKIAEIKRALNRL